MLSLDTERIYYRPSAGDKPPVAYTLGEIVSMMEQVGDWHAEVRPKRLRTGVKREDGGHGMVDTGHGKTTTSGLGISRDATYYSRDLGRRLTYAEMVEGIDQDMLPQSAEDLDWLLFCFGAEPVES